MKIKEVKGKIIKDSRKEKTIEVLIKTENGLFSSSSPSGKSKGRHEKPYYVKSIKQDVVSITEISNKICDLKIEKFSDLKKVENLLKGKIGANSLFALETCLLKSLASDTGKAVWQLINEKAKKLPFPIGNCIGGGLHSIFLKKKPDFQEFLIIPKTTNFSDNVFLMEKAREICGEELKFRKAKGKENDEKAFSTSLDNEEVLGIMQKVKEELEGQVGERIDIGVDIAASTFYTGFLYKYKNKKKRIKKKEQISFVLDLIDKYNLDYVEDPLEQEDFSGFAELKSKAVRTRPTCLIVGDDLTTSCLYRFELALKKKAINAIILKPNQVGSLLEISEIVKIAKKYGIKTVFSHRSGETLDYVLADLAFGFQADYVKMGIVGEERKVKLRRLIEIEKNFG